MTCGVVENQGRKKFLGRRRVINGQYSGRFGAETPGFVTVFSNMKVVSDVGK